MTNSHIPGATSEEPSTREKTLRPALPTRVQVTYPHSGPRRGTSYGRTEHTRDSCAKNGGSCRRLESCPEDTGKGAERWAARAENILGTSCSSNVVGQCAVLEPKSHQESACCCVPAVGSMASVNRWVDLDTRRCSHRWVLARRPESPARWDWSPVSARPPQHSSHSNHVFLEVWRTNTTS